MEHKADMTEYSRITIGTVDIYVTGYTIGRKTNYIDQPLVNGGYHSYEQGAHLPKVVIRGKILRSGVNPAITIAKNMDNKTKYFFSLDGIYYLAAGITDFSIAWNIKGKYYDAELTMVCSGIGEASA